MKTIVYDRYGPPEVLQLQERPRPVPKKHEVLVRVHATTVTIGDSRMRSFTVPPEQWIFARLYLGLLGPTRKVLGMELSGEIEAVGSQVTRFRPGDLIFASTFAAGFGGYAEYKCLPENSVMALKPACLSHAEAAAVPGAGMTALRCLRKANLQPGQAVLIYGASGAVGTNAVQLAMHLGATVTAVCSSRNLTLMKTLGASQTLDYTKHDFTGHEGAYDVVFDAVGKLTVHQARTLLKPRGIHLNVHKASSGRETLQDLLQLKNLIEAGKLKPVIDRCYSLEQVIEAHRYVDQGHKVGNVALIVAGQERGL